MKELLLFLSTILILTLSFIFIMLKTKEIIPGATSTELPGHCEIIQFSRVLQSAYTIAIACPMKDMIRLWPFPMQNPWFEDWWEKSDITQARMILTVL